MKQDEIARLLPGVFQRTMVPGSPILALLAVMEHLPAASEEVLAHLETFFDPYRAPDAFVPFLAGWVDLDRLFNHLPGRLDTATANALFPTGLGRLRELVAAAAYLSRWRGTARGLIRFLETATGESGFTVEERVLESDNKPRPFHIRVRAPQAAAPYQALIERIIASEKPAYVTYELHFE